MRWIRSRSARETTPAAQRARRLSAWLGGALAAFILGFCPALALGQLPGSQLPNPRLFTVVPPGGKAGTTAEVTFTGLDLEEPQTLQFSHPGIKAEPIVPPAPMPDPKNPKAPVPPRPPITKFKVTIPADTPLGLHDVRFVGRWGISNPRAFVVGDLTEVMEKEPNDDVDKAQRVELNSTINGALASPVDVDFYVFPGKKGQRVILSCLASSIDSRLNAGLELYSSTGKPLGHGRNYSGTDALVDCSLPEDGDYYVRVFEFTHSLGNAEHFYRLSISTAPWIDAVFPPMVEPGKETKLTVYGRNLPGGKPDPTAVIDGHVLDRAVVTVNVQKDAAALHQLRYHGLVLPHMSAIDGFDYRLRNEAGSSNTVLLTYATAPIVLDNEANDTPETAQVIALPCEIAGRIEKKGDRDWYAFPAKKGEVYSIELYSERLGAPTDMSIQLRSVGMGEPGKAPIIAEVPDDNLATLTPLKFVTRTADPPLYRFVVPADGKYLLLAHSVLGGSQADPRQVYRIRITHEQPDFRLVALHAEDNGPDAVTVRQGGQHHFQIVAWRQDGFNGPITLTAEGLPAGVTCPPQVLGAGMVQTTLVFSAAADAPPGAGNITINGTATIGGQIVVREARAASIVWAIQPGQGVPPQSRVDRSIALAVRDKAPFSVATSLDKAILFHGDKATLSVKLTRLWPDFKTPLTVQAIDLPAGLTVNNNQPLPIQPATNAASLPVTVTAAVAPGKYNIVLRCSAPIPFNKDPMAKAKPPINIVQVSLPVTITILPKDVATLTLAVPNVTVKAGMQGEVLVRVARKYDFAGEFKVQVVLPPTAKGVTIADTIIPAGKDKARLTVQVAAGTAPINLPNLSVKATALVEGNVPTIHEVKLNVAVVK